MEIRKMTEADVTAVAQLERLCFADPWSECSICSELSNPLSLWLVAVEGEAVAGYVGSQSVLGEADMMNIAISPEYRRRGLAQLLVTSLVEELKALDVYQLTLEVRASNFPAIVLYEKLGFSQIGRRPKYYRNPREDALILRKEFFK